MRKNRSALLLSGVLVIAVAAGEAILLAGVARAATTGTLTITPSPGTDVDTPMLVTSAPCPNTADSLQVVVTGPNSFNFNVVTNTTAGISFTGPSHVTFGRDMRDAAAAQGKTLVAGDYLVDLQCVVSFGGTIFADFTGTLHFSDASHYTVSSGGSPNPSPTPAPTGSPTPSPTATPPASATPSPEPTTTDTSTMPSDTTTSTASSGGGSDTSTSADSGSTNTSAQSENLPNTGAPIGLVALLGLVVLAAGLVLILLLQRRRKSASRDS